MKPLIVLVHIPKTGGTSLRVAAEQYFGKRRMLYDYGTKARLTSELVREWVYEKQDMEGFAAMVRREKIRFFSGHFHLEKYSEVFPDAHFVSWIRKPSCRLWSAWRHFAMHHGFEGSFEDFYRSPRFQNQQERFIGRNPAEFAFIGITERFGPSLNRFNRMFGLKLKQHRSNKTPGGGLSGPTADDLSAISRLNSADEALYAELDERFVNG